MDDTDKASALLHDDWWNFHEYRADFESMLAMKHSEEFQKAIASRVQYDGYPLDWDYGSFYEKLAKVPFMKDFTDGLRNDAGVPDKK